LRLAAAEAGSVDDVGAPLENGTKKLRVLGGIVLEIRILNQDDTPGRLGEATAQGGSFPPVTVLEYYDDVLMLRELRHDVLRPVRGAVVDDDQLFGYVRREHTADDGADRPCFVVDGHDDRQRLHRTGPPKLPRTWWMYSCEASLMPELFAQMLVF